MWSWRVIPFMSITASLIVGVFTSTTLNLHPIFYYSLLLILSIALVITHIRIQDKRVFSVIVWMTFATIGAFLAKSNDICFNKYHFSRISIDSTLEGIASVKSADLTGSGTQRIIMELIHCLDERGNWISCNGKLMIYNKAPIQNVHYGTVWGIKASFSEIGSAKNPHAFDFKKYMQRLGIHHQTFATEETLMPLAGFQGSQLIKFAENIHQWCNQVLKKHLEDTDEMAVASALLLGNKSLLSDELKETYTATGATHVLAVSGLHTGIVAGAIMLLMQWFSNKRLLIRIVKTLIALSVLWLFVMLTGMAPSVLRAATMFTFVTIGQTLIYRHTNIYNMVAVSAFLLIVFQPEIIHQIGFQLSYSALLGIIAFQDNLYKIVYIPNKILNFIWQLVTVSVAAQLGTLPLTIYYFHVFPFYFWLSGIIVVPMAGIILKTGILTFLLEWICSEIALIPSTFLKLSLKLMNWGVELCHQLPGVKMEGLWITESQAYILGSSIILLGIGWNLMYKKAILYSGFGLLLFFSIGLIRDIQLNRQQVITIYEDKNNLIIDYFDGTSCICITNAPSESKAIEWATQQNRWHHGILSCNILSPQDNHKCNHMMIKDHQIHFNNGQSLFFNKQRLWPIHMISSKNTPTHLVISQKQLSNKNPDKNNLQFWTLKEDGAFQLQNNSNQIFLNSSNEQRRL